MTLPAQYQWALSVEAPPRMMFEALKLYGVTETPGHQNNPTIMAWADEVGISRNVYSGDEIPWCGLFAAVVAKRAGKTIPASPLWALSWAAWGTPSAVPSFGDVLVFQRPGGGHVGLYVGEDAAAYHVLGGNTSDAVTIARLDKRPVAQGGRFRAARCSYNVRPASAVPHHLAATGALSTNEA